MYESMKCDTGDNEGFPRCAHPTGSVIPLVSLRRNRWSVWSGIGGQFAAESVVSLLRNTHPGIVRNRLKVESAVTNARSFLKVQEEFGSFDAYQWRFVDGRPIRNAWRSIKEVPASTPVSEAMSRDLKRRGFRFVGSTICYAHMQAVGMVNDHTVDCFRWREVGRKQR
jgi:DNA-3-methyladenine glycosylase I